ncbi:MAG: DEAD/DEAH box helicase [Erysipelothrix sp.]|jgi:ATP-dependent RNA helicase RhlE|nr:DEAD/DEAH box helicase [Erysipelothrix sp.]
MEFTTLGICAPILKALKDSSYSEPTPIQSETIPAALEGRDILGLAQTGTGKTAAFAIPTLQKLSQVQQHSKTRPIRALILTPTRELAVQIQESYQTYGKYLPLRSLVVFGGVGQGKQVSELRRGVDVLIATPGRLMDLIQQGFINLSKIEIFILDEADRMLDMGFIHDVKRIIKQVPNRKQTMLFSATMPPEINQIVEELLVNPVRVSITPVSSTVDTVEQFVVYVDNNHKTDWFVEFLRKKKSDSVLIFTRTKHGSDKVVKELLKRNISAKAIHGNKSQNARQAALKEFKDLTTQVLVATDIASRGIDIQDLSYVINFDMPEVAETYVHRIGRTGRAGKAGTAISLVNFSDIALLKDVEKLIKKTLVEIANHNFPLIDKTIIVKQQKGKAFRSATDKQTRTSENKQSRTKNTGQKPLTQVSKPNATRNTFKQKRGQNPKKSSY